MATAENNKKKRDGRGRPVGNPFRAFNFHCDADLYEWINTSRGDMPMTKFINQIIRERAGL